MVSSVVSQVVHFSADVVKSAWSTLRSITPNKAIKLAFVGLALTYQASGLYATVNQPILSMRSQGPKSCLFLSEPTHYYMNGDGKYSLRDGGQEYSDATKTICHYKNGDPSLGDRLAVLFDKDGYFGIPCYQTVSFELAEARNPNGRDSYNGYCSKHVAGETLSSGTKIPTKELHKIAILDILLDNSDRHKLNALITKDDKLIPIDHDYCAFNEVDLLSDSLFGRKIDVDTWRLGEDDVFVRPLEDLSPNLSKKPRYFRSFWAYNIAPQGANIQKHPMKQISEPLDSEVKQWLRDLDLGQYNHGLIDQNELRSWDSINLSQICLQEALGNRDYTIDDYIRLQNRGCFEDVFNKTLAEMHYKMKRFKLSGNFNELIRDQFFHTFRRQLIYALDNKVT